MGYSYNKKKHLELLKYAQEEKLIYHESKKDYSELREYSTMMANHLHWENRSQYLELIEQFLNGPIKLLNFKKKYQLINDASERLEADLILLEPNEKAEGFSELLDEIYFGFEVYNPDPDLREDSEISEAEFRDLVQKVFREMKDRYP
jgi:hypothetical protein